jgi:alpha-aminoadipic semialdehyde synthase
VLIVEAGASIVPELSERTDLVLGIKEPPVSEVQKLLDKDEGSGRKRTWMMFSHTHKGQVSLLNRLKPWY